MSKSLADLEMWYGLTKEELAAVVAKRKAKRARKTAKWRKGRKREKNKSPLTMIPS